MDREETEKCTWSPNADPETSPHPKHEWQRTSKTCPDILAAVGHTPLIRLNKIPEMMGVQCEMYVKCEFMNPFGTDKDRFGKRAFQEAEKNGTIPPGATLIIPNAGSAAIPLATLGSIKGHPVKVVAKEDLLPCREIMLNMLGADVIKVPLEVNPGSHNGVFGLCKRLSKEITPSVVLNPHEHRDNPLSHYDTTAEEILDALDGQVDMLVVCSRSGGLLTGIGRKLKERCPDVTIIAIDQTKTDETPGMNLKTNKDTDSLNYSDDINFERLANPSVADQTIVDKWMKRDKKEGFQMARKLLREEGIFCGVYSGLAVQVASEEAKTLDEDQHCVIVLLDCVTTYLDYFPNDYWMEAKGFSPCNNPANYWWWDVNVSELKLNPLRNIEDTFTCHDAIHMMQKYSVHQLPVVDKYGNLKGIATLSNILRNILAGKIHSQDSVKRVCYGDFSGIEEGYSATLGLILRTLQIQPYAVVFTITNGEYGIVMKPLHIITPRDILIYIKSHKIDPM